MYNYEQKTRFINKRESEVTLPKNFLVNQFSKTEKMEERLQKDLCNFTFYEIIEYYKMLNLTSEGSLKVINSQFSLYTKWCMQQNLVKDSQNHFLELKVNDFQECLNKIACDTRFIDKETILSWVNILPNPKDQFMILGLFEGIKGEHFCELVNLKPGDIQGNIINLCTGRKIEASEMLISVIENCISETKYYSMTGKGERVTPLVDKGYIIKYYPNIADYTSEFQCGRRIYVNISRILQYFDVYPKITANNIYESGKIHMIKTKAAELGISSEEYIYSEHIKEVEEKYLCRINKKGTILKYKDYL